MGLRAGKPFRGKGKVLRKLDLSLDWHFRMMWEMLIFLASPFFLPLNKVVLHDWDPALSQAIWAHEVPSRCHLLFPVPKRRQSAVPRPAYKAIGTWYGCWILCQHPSSIFLKFPLVGEYAGVLEGENFGSSRFSSDILYDNRIMSEDGRKVDVKWNWNWVRKKKD